MIDALGSDRATGKAVQNSFCSDPKAALERFRERGYHIEPELVSETACDQLLEVAASRPNAQDGTFRPIPMPHLDHPAFLAMMRFPPTVEIVERLVEGRASGIGGEYFYMRPGTAGFTCHQDNYYVQAPPDRFVSVWTALCDVGPENGGLIFYPGTQKLGSLPIRPGSGEAGAYQNPGARAIECIVPDGYSAMDVRLAKGSVVFFHSFLVHSSHNNATSDRFRPSLLATYIRAGEPFRAGRVQQRREIDLHVA